MPEKNIKVVLTGTDKISGVLDKVGARKERLKQQVDRLNLSYEANRQRVERLDLSNRRLALSTKRVEEAEKRAEAGASRLGRAYRSMHGSIGLLLGAGGVFALVEGYRRLSDEWTNANNRLRNLTNSVGEQVKLQTALFGISQRSRVELETSAALYQRLTIANDRLNLSQTERLRLTESINKAMALGGATSIEASQAVRQLTQAFSKGKLDGDEFRTIAESSALVMRLLADHIGISTGELQEWARQGKITSEVMAGAFLSGAENIDKQFQNLNLTIGASLTLLGNSAAGLIGRFNEGTGAANFFADAIKGLSVRLDILSKIRLPSWLGGDPRGFDLTTGLGADPSVGATPAPFTLAQQRRNTLRGTGRRGPAGLGAPTMPGFAGFGGGIDPGGLVGIDVSRLLSRRSAAGGSGIFSGTASGLGLLGMQGGQSDYLQGLAALQRQGQAGQRGQALERFRQQGLAYQGASALFSGDMGGLAGLAGGEAGRQLGEHIGQGLGAAAAAFGGPVGMALGQAAGPLIGKSIASVLKGTFTGMGKLLKGILSVLTPYDPGEAGVRPLSEIATTAQPPQSLGSVGDALTGARQQLAQLEEGTEEYEKQLELVKQLEAEFVRLGGSVDLVWQGQQQFSEWMNTTFADTWANFGQLAQDKWQEISLSQLSAQDKLTAFDEWIKGQFQQSWTTFSESVQGHWDAIREKEDLSISELVSMEDFINSQLGASYNRFGLAIIGTWGAIRDSQQSAEDKLSETDTLINDTFMLTWDELVAKLTEVGTTGTDAIGSIADMITEDTTWDELIALLGAEGGVSATLTGVGVDGTSAIGNIAQAIRGDTSWNDLVALLTGTVQVELTKTGGAGKVAVGSIDTAIDVSKAAWETYRNKLGSVQGSMTAFGDEGEDAQKRTRLAMGTTLGSFSAMEQVAKVVAASIRRSLGSVFDMAISKTASLRSELQSLKAAIGSAETTLASRPAPAPIYNASTPIPGHLEQFGIAPTYTPNAPIPGHLEQFGIRRAAAGFSGMVRRPMTFKVGESGDEHVRVTPNGEDGGGQPIVVNINVSAVDGPSVRNWLEQEGGEAIREYLLDQSYRGEDVVAVDGIDSETV